VVVRGAERLARLNDELRRSNEELDSFTYIASHDLKEPLRGIHNYATMLLEESDGALDAGAARRVETMIRLTRRMDAMFDSLLTYSRVGKLHLDQVPTDLQQLLRDVRDTLQVRIGESSTEIRIPEPLPTVACDPVRAAAIFQNLIANALKYNDKPERWIEVGFLERADGPPVFYVRDNGIGIPEKHWSTIFQVFRRLHGRDEFGGGVGAGLTIVKRLVERHGGRIWLESAVGEGTTFFFTLAG
jgi:light-regulated signal transduction histidine kinase (bacteriophytochrome)